VVEDGARRVATVEGGPARRPSSIEGVEGALFDPDAPQLRPDPDAWPAASAHRAASARWAARHPTITCISSVRIEPGHGGRVGAAVDAVGAHLADEGIRRLDLRVPFDHPALDQLVGGRWVRGTVGDDVVASLALRFPWAVARAPLRGAGARLPESAQRWVRRIAAVHPEQLPELARVAIGEARAAVRARHVPPRPRSRAVAGAPPGTFPFQVTRHRTISAAFGLLPGSVRRGTFVDIGCGDGRVLRAALADGFERVHGRELDPMLAEQAQRAIAGHGDVSVGDGLVAPLPDDARVVFLFNPFDDANLRRLASLVAASLAKEARPLAIVYVNPRPLEPLEAVGLVLVEANPSFSILVPGTR
jgi:SAM-dependent methyltransferase